MHALSEQRTLMRITVNSADRTGGRPVYEAIVARLRERGFAGATVLPCIMGFGVSGMVYSEMNEISSYGMPVIVEVVDTEERIMGMLPELDRMIRGGVITLERAHVILSRGPGGAGPADQPLHAGGS